MSRKTRFSGQRYPRSGLPEGQAPTRPYFVPAFGIRRNVLEDDEQVRPLFRAIRKSLGQYYGAVPPRKLNLASLDKDKFIERMREARERPNPDHMRSLAFSIKDGLSATIAHDPAGLTLPLGKIERFGARRDYLGIVPLGWRGYGSRYARRDEQDQPLALGTIVAEHQLALGAIATAMSPNRRFVIDGLAQTPHILIARHSGRIRDEELWSAQDKLEVILEGMTSRALRLEDPIIYLNNRVGDPAEVINARNPSSVVPDTSQAV